MGGRKIDTPATKPDVPPWNADPDPQIPLTGQGGHHFREGFQPLAPGSTVRQRPSPNEFGDIEPRLP